MDLGKILKGVVPFIASALPGPFGAAAKGILSGVFGISEDADGDAIAQALAKATPEQMVALQNAENDFKLKMTALGFQNTKDMDELAKSDTANARAREVSIAQTGHRDYTPVILALSAVGGFIASLWYVLAADIDKWGQTKVGIITTLLGTVTTVVILIFGYYFGSSSGSQAKNAMLDKLTPKP